MRAVFQAQPEVAHVYLGSKRHMMRRIFSDANEPFWRSAKQVELGVIDPKHFRGYIRRRFDRTGRVIAPDGASTRSSRRPAGTPTRRRSCATSPGRRRRRASAAMPSASATALAKVLRSEHAHFSLLWERASSVQRLLLAELAREPGRPLSGDYRRRHNLPAPSTVQRAIEALERDELVARDRGQRPDRRAVPRGVAGA